MAKLSRKQKGDVLVETVVGLACILVPLALISVDLATLYMCSQFNGRLAKSAARAAGQTLPPSFGNKVTGSKAPDGVDHAGGDDNAPTTVQNTPPEVARLAVANQFQPNYIIEDVQVSYFAEKTQYYAISKHFSSAAAPPPPGAVDGDPPVGQAFAITCMKIRLPVPLPGLQKVILQAQATEAVTSVPWVPNRDN